MTSPPSAQLPDPSRHPPIRPGTRALGLVLGLSVLLAPIGCRYAAAPPVQDRDPPPEPDPAVLHVTHVALDPWLPPPDSADPPDAGWPDPGQEIRWVGHVYNLGDDTARAVRYAWAVDGVVVAESAADFPPGESTVALDRTWSDTRERIRLSIEDPPNPEDADTDLDRTVVSDGLGLGFWVDARLVDYMDEHPEIPPFRVWAPRAVEVWNGILDRYSDATSQAQGTSIPAEVLDRLRVQQIEVLPAGSPHPGLTPTDLMWFFSERNRLSPDPGDPPEVFEHPWVVLLHELIHARGVHDLYSYRVFQGVNGSEVRIREPDGSPAAGSMRMPLISQGGAPGEGTLFRESFRSFLMGRGYTIHARVNPLTAYGLNQVAGRRTPKWEDERGNLFIDFANGPGGNLYLLDVPDSARIELITPQGYPPAGAVVEVFFDHHDQTYHNLFLAEPDLVMEADANGTVTLPLGYFQAVPPAGRVHVDTDVIIFRVTVGDEWDYTFLPVYELNMEYVRGNRAMGEAAVVVMPM